MEIWLLNCPQQTMHPLVVLIRMQTPVQAQEGSERLDYKPPSHAFLTQPNKASCPLDTPDQSLFGDASL